MTYFKKTVAVFLIVLMLAGIFIPTQKAHAIAFLAAPAAPVIAVTAKEILQWVSIAAISLWGANEAHDLYEKNRYSD